MRGRWLATTLLAACGSDGVPAEVDGGQPGDTSALTEDAGEVGDTAGDGESTTDTGDSSGSGDGDGDGDGDAASGDGAWSGDGTAWGDGDGTWGDGDASGDGDGDGTSASGDGDGDGDGDGTSASGDGDGTSGDGDGDGTGGDGDGDGDGTSASGDGDGDGSSSSGDGDGDACDVLEFTFNAHPPSVVFVLDKSTSMVGSSSTWVDHDGDPATPDVSRWFALHEAVTEILGEYDPYIDSGVKVFPSDTPEEHDGCAVDPGLDVPVAPMNGASILAFIPSATADLMGSTPSGPALIETYDALFNASTPGQRAVIFVTDGQSNCFEPPSPPSSEAVAEMIATAYRGGIAPSVKTYVIGMYPSDPEMDAELNAFASAGGAPRREPANGIALLTEGFEAGFAPGWSTTSWSTSSVTATEGARAALSGALSGAATLVQDGFESGDLGGAGWVSGGAAGWMVGSAAPQSGSFEAASGVIAHGESSDLRVDVVLDAPGELRFWHRESTEDNYDHFQLVLDGALVEEWDGLNPWAQEVVPLSVGSHVIEFRYLKDGSVSEHDDAAYVDDVTITRLGASRIELSVDLPQAGHVSFDRRAGMPNAEFLVFDVDGVETARWGGSNVWTETRLSLPAGPHTLGWQHAGSDPAAWVRLDDVRVETGGTYSPTKYYETFDTPELFAALDQILATLAGCDLTLDPPPIDPNQVVVEVGGVEVTPLDPTLPGFDCTTDEGWFYSQSNVITLCAGSCDDFLAMPMPTADVAYFCETT